MLIMPLIYGANPLIDQQRYAKDHCNARISATGTSNSKRNLFESRPKSSHEVANAKKKMNKAPFSTKSMAEIGNPAVKNGCAKYGIVAAAIVTIIPPHK